MTTTCITCTDQDCPQQGSDNAGCEDWSNIQVEVEGTHDAVPESNLQAVLETRTMYVYIAGRMSGQPSEYLANVREMSAASRALMEAGFCPINPAGDLLEGLVSEQPIPKELFQRRSLDLLRLLRGRRGAMLVLHATHRGGRRSEGVHREIRECELLGIPVVYSIEELAQIRGTE